MTQEQLKDNFRVLLTINHPLREIEELFLKSVQCGALNYSEEEEDSYRTAKIIYHSILCKMASRWQPLAQENKNDSANLQKFL
ncbi:hypothetical protein BCF58_0986 [Chryseobacterium defluvii]|uniref:Uncharacterized protein n=1 Tax=Chryseobacterium defluvii TaxID=160396 RepID=A0A495SQI5_9FLAO|nr:hypothetical protein BCF58_0986 [Chryseobacterium defluvii]